MRLGSRLTSSVWYWTCTNMLINHFKCYHSYTDLLRYVDIYIEWLHLQLFNIYLTWGPIFKWIEFLLFINWFLQVWYQHEEDIHLLPVICFSFALCEIFLGKWDFQKCPETFLLSVNVDPHEGGRWEVLYLVCSDSGSSILRGTETKNLGLRGPYPLKNSSVLAPLLSGQFCYFSWFFFPLFFSTIFSSSSEF